MQLDGRPVRFATTREAIAARHRRRPPGAQPHPALLGRREHHARAAGRAAAPPIDYAALYARGAALARSARPRHRPATRRSRASASRRCSWSRSPRRCRSRSRVLLLDEPTASLTQHETRGAVRAPAASCATRASAIVFVSHKLEEVFEICDRVTVLRDGRNACDSRTMEGLDRQDIVSLMIGRSERIPDWTPARPHATAPRRWNCAASPPRPATGTSTFTLQQGEILGLYGLVGAGPERARQGDPRRAPDHRGRGPGRRASRRGSARVAEALAPARHRLCQRGPEGRGADPASTRCWTTPASPSGSASRNALGLAHRRGGHARRSSRCIRKLEVRTPSLRPDRRQPLGRQPAEGQRGEVARRGRAAS